MIARAILHRLRTTDGHASQGACARLRAAISAGPAQDLFDRNHEGHNLHLRSEASIQGGHELIVSLVVRALGGDGERPGDALGTVRDQHARRHAVRPLRSGEQALATTSIIERVATRPRRSFPRSGS
jgi:hypothetical protein